MTGLARLGILAAFVAVLTGCGNDGRATNPVVAAVGQMAKATLTKGKANSATAAAPVSRSDLAAFGKPILRVTSAALGQDAFLTIADTKSDVVTWTAQGQATFTLRDGILIQTRGLGPDLMSADAPTLAVVRGGGQYPRVYFFLGEDDRGTRRSYECTATLVGRETIDVMGKSHATQHVTETCTRGNTKITNDYWIDGAMIRKSRQWASTRIGYIDFARVID